MRAIRTDYTDEWEMKKDELQPFPMQAMRATQDRVITICTPPRCVAWINHVLGYTMEQWVLFDPDAGGGTRVSTWIEFTGADFDGSEVEKLVTKFAAEWFGKFRAECDRMVRKA
jgi:hypothetical protein